MRHREERCNDNLRIELLDGFNRITLHIRLLLHLQKLLFSYVFSKGNDLAASDGCTCCGFHLDFLGLVDLRWGTKVINTSDELDNWATNLVRKFLVALQGCIISKNDFDIYDSCLPERIKQRLEIAKRMEHVCRYPLDENIGCDLLHLLLQGLGALERRMESDDPGKTLRPFRGHPKGNGSAEIIATN